MQRFPNLYFVIGGQSFPGIVKDLPQERFIYSPWVKADGHGYRMATLNADIAIAPLTDTVFNHNKSCVKFYEYAALGIPTVASDVAPYSDEMKDGVTGLLFKTPDQFISIISSLIEDPQKRKKIGEAGYTWAKKNRDIDVIAKDWVSAMEEISKVKTAK
jgi:glycosyltransferase involved in cell wall biosynthesis